MEQIPPRLRGINEHLQRARLFLDLSRRTDDSATAFRLRLAAVYSCRAVADIMLTAASRQQVRNSDGIGTSTREDLEASIASRLAHYELIERIRIHDFHRFGLVPTQGSHQTEVSVGGPIKVVGHSGSAAMFLTDYGIATSTTGEMNVKLQRPLVRRDDYFFDDELNQWNSLEHIVTAFLESTPDVIADFESLLLV